MFEELKGKKLLWLGGIPRAAYVIKRAMQLGIYVIVADIDETNPGKEIANEAYNIDAMDVDSLTELCLKESIDGIMTGYCDILLPSVLEVSKRASIPCYMTEDMISAATNKGFFKSLCEKYNVPVPHNYEIDKADLEKSAKSLSYPVFIKPLDASGSRGADVCNDSSEFVEKYEYALSFSKQGDVVVEDFLSGTEFILDYLIVDGKPYLLSMADRYTIEGRGAAINSPNLMILPSKNLNRYVDTVTKKVENMFVESGFENGLIFLQGYADENRIAFYEMGCRLGGTWPYIDEYFTGLNPMDLLFSHSLTGKMLNNGNPDSISPFFNGYAAIIYYMSSQAEGTIGEILGIEELQSKPWVVDVMQFYHVGDSFDMERQTDVRFLSTNIVAENINELRERVKYAYELIKVNDVEGNNLLSKYVDIDMVTEG